MDDVIFLEVFISSFMLFCRIRSISIHGSPNCVKILPGYPKFTFLEDLPYLEDPDIYYPKNHWTLLWRGLTLSRRVLGSPNHQLWDPMILRVLCKFHLGWIGLVYSFRIFPWENMEKQRVSLSGVTATILGTSYTVLTAQGVMFGLGSMKRAMNKKQVEGIVYRIHRGWNTTQLYGDCLTSHYEDPY